MAYDLLIIGSGLAGLSAALEWAPHGRVAVIAKSAIAHSASNRAQGGIAAALDADDSVEDHVRDTLAAGGGLCDAEATRRIAADARGAIAWLQAQGVDFNTTAPGRPALHLTREGGHGRRRIVHAADATGRAVIATLAAQARLHPNITLLEHHCAIDLLAAAPAGTPGARCQGVQVLDLQRGTAATLAAPHVVLATGGAGQVYAHTTTPATATGDGIAMAWRAGCRVANLEFTQFHPTCLYHPQGDAFLISEAVRGEGGLLRLHDGTRFMPAHDARAELAPRDVVARAIDLEMKRHGLDCVYLDISHQPRAFLREHFPTIYAHCLALGIDMATAPIPVAPAAHYTCGGIVADTAGRTDLPGLYAIGETACTGLHGANRLASNSLLECVVTGRAAAQAILQQRRSPEAGDDLQRWGSREAGDNLQQRGSREAGNSLQQRDSGIAGNSAQQQYLAGDASASSMPGASRRAADMDAAPIAQTRLALRQLMSAEVGIVRNDASLARAARRIKSWHAAVARQARGGAISRDLLELRNLLQVSELIVRAASTRHESRGAHFNHDWPDTLAEARPTVMRDETTQQAAA